MRLNSIPPAAGSRDPDEALSSAQQAVAEAFGFQTDSSAAPEPEQEDVLDWTTLGARDARGDDESGALPTTVRSSPAADLIALQAQIAAALGARS